MTFRHVLVTSTALLAGSFAVVAPSAPASADTTVTISGYGFGHGKGLSQYGARNRASAGQSYATIAQHYYPGTAWGKATGSVRVLLTKDTSADVHVVARKGLTLRALGSGRTWKLPATQFHTRVARWRIAPAGHSSRIWYRAAGSWHPWRTVRGDAQFGAGGRPVTLVTPHGASAYRGALRSVSTNASGSRRDTVNVLPLESYVRGVVAQEVPASWPQAAVRAQTVAARTYAAFERRASRGDSYDLCDTSHCQVYGGVAAEHPKADAAVKATSKRVLTYQGQPAFTQFSASNGGWSVRGSMPYLRAAQDSFDRGAPGDPWQATFSGAAIARNWPGLGTLQSVRVVARDGHGRLGGRATSVRVTGSKSSVTVAGDTFASYLGLRSTMFRIS